MAKKIVKKVKRIKRPATKPKWAVKNKREKPTQAAPDVD